MTDPNNPNPGNPYPAQPPAPQQPYAPPPGYSQTYSQPQAPYPQPPYQPGAPFNPNLAYDPDQQRPPNGFAVTALVLGIFGLIPFYGFIPAVLAIIFGALGRSRSKRYGARHQGFATAGLVMGLVGTIVLGLGVLLSILFFGVLPAISGSKNKLAAIEIKRTAAQVERYRTEHNAYPPSLFALAASTGEKVSTTDMWDRAYVYQTTPTGFELRSLGADANNTADDIYWDANSRTVILPPRE
jgi:hypothetical protein